MWEDDICWCADSDECDNTKCFRHLNNRKTSGIFTCGSLMDTEYCEKNKKEYVDKVVRVWIGNDYLDLEYEFGSELSEDEIYESAFRDILNRISIEII